MTQIGGKLALRYKIFADQIEPQGRLILDKRCHALWYYLVLCEKARLQVGDSIEDQIIYDDERWLDRNYEQIARTVATLYGLESPSDYWNYWPLVLQEAARLGVTVDPEIRNLHPGSIIIH